MYHDITIFQNIPQDSLGNGLTLIVRANYNNDIRVKSAKLALPILLIVWAINLLKSNRQRDKEISELQTAIYELQLQINELKEYK